MKTLFKTFAVLALALSITGNVRAQNHTQSLSVTTSPLTITADGNYNSVLVRENSATPTAVFSITLAGSSTALNYPAGTQFVFYGNFTNGTILGTIVATTSGPFSFVAVESSGPPSQSVKNTIISGGSSGNATSIQGLSVSSTAPSGVQCLQSNSGDTQALWGSCSGTAGVTNFSAGNLSPLFTSSVATSTTTPALTFSLSTAAANTVFANCTGSTAAPSYCSLTGAMLPNPSASTLGGVESLSVVSHNFLTGISTSGVPTQAQPAYSDISGTPTATSVALTMPSWFAVAGSPVAPNGTLAVTAAAAQTSHQVIGTCGSATSFAPCALVAGDIPSAIPIANIGSAGLSATAPITIASTGAIAITGAAGQILAGASPTFTATPALGTDNSVAGTLQLANGSAAFHSILQSAATANNTVSLFATAPVTGDLVDCVTASTTCTLTDSGVLAANVLLAASPTNHSLMLGAGTQTLSALGAATNGQIPIGSTGANPVLATITAGNGITVANGAGTITLTPGTHEWTSSFGATSAIPLSSTRFLPPNGTTTPVSTETAAQMVAGRAMTFTSMHVDYTTVANGASASGAWTLRSCTPTTGLCSSASSSITCTVGNSAGSCNDTSHTLSVSAGDLIDIQVVENSTAGPASNISVTLEWY